MSLVRWDPNRELEQMMNRFNRFFGDTSFFQGAPSVGKESLTLADWSPACDIQETSEAYVVNAELPDVKKEDVKVTVQNGVLSLAGERRQEKEEKGRKFHKVERSYGRFERSFALPGSIDEAKIGATFRDGVLHVTLPKAAGGKNGGHEIKIA